MLFLETLKYFLSHHSYFYQKRKGVWGLFLKRQNIIINIDYIL